MKDKNKYSQNGSDTGKILDLFPASEREKVDEIWELSKKGQAQPFTCSPEEIEEALENVHSRIGWDERKKRNTIAGSIINRTRFMVAAVALIALGIGILTVPKTVTVPNAERTVIELPDGSSVEMNSGTTIRYNRLFSFTNRTVILNGEAYFSVQPGEEPFIVQANGTATEVTGTEFNVRSWHSDPASETTVTVTEGSVQFYSEDNQSNSVSITAGQKSRWNTFLMKPGQPETSPLDPLLAWRENKLVFQETAFIVILNELERSFDVKIELDVEGMEMETLTAYYNPPANLETILEDLCTVKGLRYTKIANGYRIFK